MGGSHYHEHLEVKNYIAVRFGVEQVQARQSAGTELPGLTPTQQATAASLVDKGCGDKLGRQLNVKVQAEKLLELTTAQTTAMLAALQGTHGV